MGRKARARASLAASHSTSVDNDDSPDAAQPFDPRIAALTDSINRLSEQLAVEREAHNPKNVQSPALVPDAAQHANCHRSDELSAPAAASVYQLPADNQYLQLPCTPGASGRKLHDLPTFSGLAEDWPLFEASFHQSTASFAYTETENTFRLRRALIGDAKDTVDSLLIHANKVREIMSILKFRFGRPEQMVRAQIQKVSELPVISDSRIESIVPFATRVRNLVAILDTDNTRPHLMNPQLLEDLTFKLPISKRVEWAKVAINIKPYATLVDFNNWLKETADYISLVLKPNNAPATLSKTVRSKPVLHTAEQSSNTTSKCHLCNSNTHRNSECIQFTSLSVPNRWSKVKQHKWCFSCLQPGHQTLKCRRRNVCGVNNCGRYHHHLLHDSEHTINSPARTVAAPHNSHSVLNCTDNCVDPVLLFKALPVKLYGPSGLVETVALLDEGSSVTVIDEQLADQLELKNTGGKEPLTLQWYGGKCNSEMSRRVSLKISGLETGHTIYELTNVRTVPTLNLPTQSVSMSTIRQQYPVFDDLPLYEASSKPPRLMIGLQHAHLGIALRKIECHDGPIAVYTKLGWMVYGPYHVKNIPRKPVVLMCRHHSDTKCRVEKMFEDYFEHENLGVKPALKQIESEDDKRARCLLSTTTVRVGNQFETGLLWKESSSSLPDSRDMALRRLEAVERKMDRDNDYGTAYRKIIDDYIRKGYARKLTKKEEESFSIRTWYLPHFGVKNPNKPQKLRLVFDAAATVNDVSLNSHLLTGPDLNQPLLSVLFNFRVGVIGVTGDIAEMFHQVRIASTDQDSQRFVWRDGDRSRPVDTYVMCVMIFGAACSPCSAQYVKNVNADEMGKGDPDAVKAIKRHHYVDEYVSSFESTEEAIRITKAVREIHRRGGFHLRNFTSNDPSLLSAIGDSNTFAEQRLIGDVETEKVLGVRWDTATDCFTFKLTFARINVDVISKTRRPTKREVLSVAMSVFDPFGLVANYTIYAKVLIQELWRLRLEWDDYLPDEQYGKWLSWMEELQSCTTTSVPRCYSPFFISSPERELHIFSDASETAFAAVSYWRIKRPDGSYDVSFIMGKTKCAPRKLLSMPRLELQAAVLGSRLYNNIITLHEAEVTRTTFWTDSKTVAQWIKGEPRRYKPFVAHRIAEIHETTNGCEWKWIPSRYNIADDATRADYPIKVEANGRWLRGPDFVCQPDPVCFEEPNAELDSLLELRPKYIYFTSIEPPIIDFSRFSKYRRLRRTVGWVLRFIAATRVKRSASSYPNGELTASELTKADLLISRLVQAEEFLCEIALLQNGGSVDKTSSIFKLSPQLDDDGVLRVFGRIDAASCVSSDSRRPIIMPKRHYVTELIVRHHHDFLKHQHLEAIVCAVRKKYWIPDLRALARKVRSSCQLCRIQSASPEAPKMGQHPTDRLTPFIRPFTYTGLDYFGPLFVTIGRRREKRWVALFSCLTTRAVHLEIAADLSTDACLLCIRNLINIRGVPARIRSDNGTNFVGAAKELGRLSAILDTATIQRELSGRGIEWIFNSPANPEAGGCWERMVQSVKRVLNLTLKEVAPQVETLRSLLIEAANIVNNRPLTHVPVDPDSEEPLTPNHFLIGSTNLTPGPGSDDRPICLGKQWRILQQLKDRFWTRWVNEYLPELTRRTKWHKDTTQLKCGDLVLICDTNLARGQWKRVRVVEVFPGRDGIVRQAMVKTADGLIKRPSSRLAILNVNGEH